MLKTFIDYLETQVKNKSIYVLGAQGQTGNQITEEWIKKREHYVARNYNKAIALWKSRRDTYSHLRAFDCSGLGMYWCQNIMGLSKTDLTANGMMGKCTRIAKAQLKKGDWVFKVSAGRAHHVGYVVDDKLNVVESQGRAYGVVKRALSKGGWNAYGRPEWFASEIEQEPDYEAVFTRVLRKGYRGEDVKNLQRMLNDVHNAGIDDDGIFGKRTLKAVKSFQRAKGLKVDGLAGKNTITALGGVWRP